MLPPPHHRALPLQNHCIAICLILNAEPFGPYEKLVKISSMPDWVQPAFKGMTQLNRVQRKVYDAALFKPPPKANPPKTQIQNSISSIAKPRPKIAWLQQQNSDP